MQSQNWTVIQQTCPEFNLNFWDFLFAIIAFIGAVLNFYLMFFFKRRTKVAVFLPNLAGYDYGLCFLYLSQYLYPSIAMYFQSDIMAKLRIDLFWEIEMIKDFFEIILTLLVFCIIFEKFLWTCSSRARHSWRFFVVGNYKFWTLVGFTLYAFFAAFMHNWNLLQLSDVPFCDVSLLPMPIKQPFFRFIQLYFIPYISDIFIGLIFIFILITLIRISHVGTGDKPVDQEEVNLETQEGNDHEIAKIRIKKTIICMVIVCSMFLIRAIFWYAFIKPNSTRMSTRNRHYKLMKRWVFDCVSMILSASRILVYYLVCKMDLVAEYPASGVVQ